MTGASTAALAAVGLALWMSSRLQVEEVPDPGATTLAGLVDNAAEELTAPFVGLPASWQANEAAFLMMIRHAEGTADPLGYQAIFGHTAAKPRTFASFADHPRIAQRFSNSAGRTLWTTAAGAYQLLAVSDLPGGGRTSMDTWDRLRSRLNLPDFSPPSQDRAAVELIDDAGALLDVRAGRFAEAVGKVRKIWASLPGAGYSQPERPLAWLEDRYREAGGTVA